MTCALGLVSVEESRSFTIGSVSLARLETFEYGLTCPMSVEYEIIEWKRTSGKEPRFA